MIRETVITSCAPDGAVHVAPMGVTVEGDGIILAPFQPSVTLNNLMATRVAVINHTDDVRVFAGCVTRRRTDWPTVPAERIAGRRLADALAHEEIRVTAIEDDPQRPRFHCAVIHAAAHRRFAGFNRAQAAVIEGAILVSRLHLLPPEKIDTEMTWLATAVDKTAGPLEREAWDWLTARVAEWRAEHPAR
jgi:hypothetical protein